MRRKAQGRIRADYFDVNVKIVFGIAIPRERNVAAVGREGWFQLTPAVAGERHGFQLGVRRRFAARSQPARARCDATQRRSRPEQMFCLPEFLDCRNLRGRFFDFQAPGAFPPPTVKVRFLGRDQIPLPTRYALHRQPAVCSQR